MELHFCFFNVLFVHACNENRSFCSNTPLKVNEKHGISKDTGCSDAVLIWLFGLVCKPPIPGTALRCCILE